MFEALRHDHKVFIDTTLTVGEKWAERIQTAIKESDYLIIFLSEHSVHSKMAIAEIETAHHHGKAFGKPSILPVQLAFNEALAYPLSAYLNPLQWALWDSGADTPRLIAELSRKVFLLLSVLFPLQVAQRIAGRFEMAGKMLRETLVKGGYNSINEVIYDRHA